MKMKYGISLAIIAVLSGTAASAMAADLYVATTGLDTNPGTQASPFLTITKADSVATAGTTVHVAPGTYTYTGSGSYFKTTANGTSAAHITFISDTQWGAVISPRLADTVAWEIDGSYVDIVGFEIKGQSGDSSRIGLQFEPPSTGTGNSSAKHNHVHNIGNNITCSTGGAGILFDVYYSSSIGHYTADSNWVHDIGLGTSGNCNQIQGIYVSAPNSTITNNLTYNCGYACIHLWHDADHEIVVNNTVFNANAGTAGGIGILVGSGNWYWRTTPGDYNIVYNNIVRDSYDAVAEESDGHGNGTHSSYHDNLLYGNTNCQNITSCLNGSTDVSGTVNSDPQFINYIKAGGGNYRLRCTSPAINVGTSTDAPSTDFNGTSRPYGSGYDIGAYEYAGCPG